jgi:hypothetical protein
MNSTLVRHIRETPQGIVDTALAALKEATLAGYVRNPSGFLSKAITDTWTPNATYQTASGLQEFNEWWKWAYAKGLVKAAMQKEGIQYVLTAEEDWVSFQEIALSHPVIMSINTHCS